MGRTSYTTLKERAEAAAGVAVAEGPQGAVTLEDATSFAEAAERKRFADAAKEEQLKHLERGEVFIARAIDPHEGRLMSITSGWVPITPSLCTEMGKYGGGCGWDAAVKCGFKGGWDSIHENMVMPKSGLPARQHVLEILRQHKATQHVGSGPAHIRTPEQARAARAVRALPETFIENPRLD